MNQAFIASRSAAIILAMLLSRADAASVTLFSGSTYDANTAVMDAALGITGYTIEDFEDVNLISNLTISYTNPTAGPLAVLPTVYNEATIGLYTNNLWDGEHALVNTPQNQEWNQPGVGIGAISDRVTFHISGGAYSVGIGFGNLQSDIVDHEILVNGSTVITALETLPGWVSGVRLRNGYLRIDADPGEVIESFSIDIGTGFPDGMVLDRLAVSAVPEPGYATLSLLVMATLVLTRRRHRLFTL